MRWSEWVADLAIAVLLAVVTVAGSTVAAGGTLAVQGYVLVAAAALALALRRRMPLGTLGVVTLCTAVYLLLGYAYGPVLIVFMLSVYSAFRHTAGRRVVWVAAGAFVAVAAHLVGARWWLGVVPVAAWVAVPGAIGYGLRVRFVATASARSEVLRRRVDEERLRVAQEVHDIVVHGLAVIKMQADIALHVMDKRPGQAEEALTAISRTSAEALHELRATLASVHPAPGLAGLEALQRRMSAAGVEVSLVTEGDAVLPAAVDLAAYRVVQESLTNVLRHGGCSRASVTVRCESDRVTIDVVNPFYGNGSFSLGSGIAGMRARVEGLGGSFEAGVADRRFEVSACLPLA